jgi:hypothetical protein
MMQWHGVKLESAKRSYFHICCRQFGSASKLTILDACEYNIDLSCAAAAGVSAYLRASSVHPACIQRANFRVIEYATICGDEGVTPHACACD